MLIKGGPIAKCFTFMLFYKYAKFHASIIKGTIVTHICSTSSTGLLDEGALLGLTSISSSDSASLLLMLLVLALDVLVELAKKDEYPPWHVTK